MAVAVPSTLPMKLRKVEPSGKAAAEAGAGGCSRVLVMVTVLGSAGPLRFLVDEGETVTGLIRSALRCYAREGRMPLLRADPADFLLYSANGRSDALKADERISFNGCRSFLLWQKAARQAVADDAASEPLATTAANSSPGRKGSGGWKGGLNKFLSFSFKDNKLH
ncbi:uncharacterized protein At4g22758-like [Phragmites australis]|uniref:uncharacterized protein At4g22758-like n=1 Tax=Phragmites australis TaxID=29695 RepID=UPI002D770E9A|nr:uncharacterized protein At4g22758-like [Phragmites australis]